MQVSTNEKVLALSLTLSSPSSVSRSLAEALKNKFLGAGTGFGVAASSWLVVGTFGLVLAGIITEDLTGTISNSCGWICFETYCSAFFRLHIS